MIFIQPESLLQMKGHAEKIFPDECCGFMYGIEEANGNREVTLIREVDNARPGDKRRRFEITPKDYMQAERFALEKDLILLGVYHSHPNHPAIPSEQDRIAAQPYFSYIIVSVMQGKTDLIRSWRLSENETFEEELFSTTHLNQSI